MIEVKKVIYDYSLKGLKYNCRVLDEYDVYLMYKDDEDEVSD